MIMIMAILVAYFLVALGVICYRVYEVNVEPATMPGGGYMAIVVTGLLWPVVLVVALWFALLALVP